uniref:methyltransferase domain-containing protein n=1 Tax=Ningiella ruwaisensis TaxID=2364274 RepID=UPI00109F3A77|nr:methyltransferase domain-containing protein [Ningiella ruwaisensis]
MKSGNFDGIANKFDQNIYGTTKGRLRHLLLLHYLNDEIEADKPLDVLDAGAGTGMMSLAFAEKGHKLHLLDVSAEALEIAKSRLSAFAAVNFELADVDAFKSNAFSFDMVLCHAVLEWLDEPLRALDILISKLKPNGVLSLSFFNQDAMLFNNAIYGNFDYIAKGMKVRNTVRLNPHNPQKPADILAFLEQRTDIKIELSAGIRCFHDYMRDISQQSSGFEQILALEKQYGKQAPFKFIGKYFYIKARKA